MMLVAASEIVCLFVFVLKNKHNFVLAASAISRLSSIDFFLSRLRSVPFMSLQREICFRLVSVIATSIIGRVSMGLGSVVHRRNVSSSFFFFVIIQ